MATNLSVGEITQLLHRSREGDEQAKQRLFQIMLPDLERLASSYLRGEKAGRTMQTGDLVNELYLKIGATLRDYKDRTHFKAYAAWKMRRLLIDKAREKRSRGQRVEVSESDGVSHKAAVEALALDEALSLLGENDPRAARVVELKFFGGLTVEEIALELNLSEKTIKNDWRFARAFLKSKLG